MDLFIGHPYGKRITVDEGIEVEFTDAGHLLAHPHPSLAHRGKAAATCGVQR
jgi:hypothetical protein